MQRNGGDGQVIAALAAHSRRQLFVAGAAPLPHSQARAAVRLVQIKNLSRVDQVRVADLFEVHAPQLGPSPRPVEEQLGDVPQRVARLDGVRLRCVGCQFGQRHAGIGDFLGGAALLRCDRQRVGCLHWRSDDRQSRLQDEDAQQQPDGPAGSKGATMATHHGQGTPGALRGAAWWVAGPVLGGAVAVRRK